MEFIPSLPVLSAFTLTAFILTLSPGPDMALFIGRALTHGRSAGMAAMLGAMAGLLIHTFLVTFGISALIKASPNSFLALKFIGAIYLLWLAIQAIRQGSVFTTNEDKTPSKSGWNNWLTGLGINLLNPKIILFYITFLPQFVSPIDENASSKIFFLGCYFVVLATVLCSAMIYAVDKFANVLRQHPKVIRIIDWLFAGIFSAFAIKILLTERG